MHNLHVMRQDNTRCEKFYTLKHSVKGKYVENPAEPSFKLTSAVFPESHSVASFIVFKFQLTKLN